MLQYRGALLELKDHGNVLADLDPAAQHGEEVLVTVLICRDGLAGEKQRIGMVVRQVLDVSVGTPLEQDALSEETGMELVLVKEKLTLVRRGFGAKTTSAWQEVA